MKVVKQSAEIMCCGGMPIDGKAMLKHIEMCGRVCYKSEDKIGDDSAEKFVRRIIKSGHESVLEHASITVRFVCDRGVSHEIVRHRIASYCVTGDTVIRSMNQKSWMVKELFDWQFNEQRKGRLKLIAARSMDDETRTYRLLRQMPDKQKWLYGSCGCGICRLCGRGTRDHAVGGRASRAGVSDVERVAE